MNELARPPAARTSPVKITDVAAAAGVAPMTVSRVINTPDRVSPETTAKVRTAIEQLGYVPNLIAGGLSSRKSRMVAAIVPTVAHPMFAGVVQAFSNTLRAAGYQVMLSIGGYGETDDASLVRALLGRRPDALLLTGTGYSPTAMQLLTEAGIPIVEIWDVPAHPVDMVVGFDHAQVGAKVAEYLVGKGHRRFATVSAGDVRAKARIRGFSEVIAQAGGNTIAMEQALPAPSTIAAGRKALRAMLPVLNERCALFCSSDMVAFGVVTEARMQGIAVPDLLSVVGFGNLEISEMSEPSITSVALDGDLIGRTSAEFILSRLAGAELTEGGRVQVPFTIVERATA